MYVCSYLCPVITNCLGAAVVKSKSIPTQATFYLELVGDLSHHYNRHIIYVLDVRVQYRHKHSLKMNTTNSTAKHLFLAFLL